MLSGGEDNLGDDLEEARSIGVRVLGGDIRETHRSVDQGFVLGWEE